MWSSARTEENCCGDVWSSCRRRHGREVVDLLEAVEIEAEHRELLAGSGCSDLPSSRGRSGAVGEARSADRDGRESGSGFGLPAVAQVAERHDVVQLAVIGDLPRDQLDRNQAPSPSSRSVSMACPGNRKKRFAPLGVREAGGQSRRSLLRAPDLKPCEALVDGDDGLSLADHEALDRRVGEVRAFAPSRALRAGAPGCRGSRLRRRAGG